MRRSPSPVGSTSKGRRVNSPSGARKSRVRPPRASTRGSNTAALPFSANRRYDLAYQVVNPLGLAEVDHASRLGLRRMQDERQIPGWFHEFRVIGRYGVEIDDVNPEELYQHSVFGKGQHEFP